MKLVNFKCLNCNKEKETDPLTTDEYNDMMEKIKQGIGPVFICEDCGEEMILFNWAQHSRCIYLDD